MKRLVTALKEQTVTMIMSRGERDMTKNRIAKYVANTALLAVLAAAGIGAYQLGTSGTDEKIQEKVPSYYDEGLSTETTPDSAVDAGTSLVEAELEDKDVSVDTGTDLTSNKDSMSENVDAGDITADSTGTENMSENTTLTAENSLSEAADVVGNESVNTSANVQEAPKLSFSEDTLMEWPVHGSILRDYNMDQTVYYATLDQYKLSPSIVVGAEEGAPVTCSVKGKVYSVEEDPQTGTTLTMELGDGYQAVYGQLKDLTVKEGDIVEKGTVIGYINAPTRYYSSEGSNLYFAMEKNGEPVDPIAYLP